MTFINDETPEEFKKRLQELNERVYDIPRKAPSKQDRAKTKSRGKDFGSGLYSKEFEKFKYEKSLGKFKIIDQKKTRRKK